MGKILLKFTVISTLIVLWLYCGFYLFKHPIWKDYNYTKCGVVTQSLEGSRAGKYRMINELYLGIKYDDGTFVGEKVDVTTYMTKKIGDRICMNLYDEESKSDAIGGILILMGVIMVTLLCKLFKFS